MLSEDGSEILCEVTECDERIPNHKWGRIKAEGWYFARDDLLAWCPHHLPEWVVRRRAKNEE